MSQVVFQVILNVPEGMSSATDDPEVMEEAILQALEEAREDRKLPGVSHVTVTFEDIV